MSREYTTSYGSGTLPHFAPSPILSGIMPDNTFPVPSQRDALLTRTGEGAVILNPEDFSVHIGGATQAIAISTSRVALPTNALVYRRALVIHNSGPAVVYLGFADLTTANGMPLAVSEKMGIDVANNLTIYAIADSDSEVRIMELS